MSVHDRENRLQELIQEGKVESNEAYALIYDIYYLNNSHKNRESCK